MYTQCLNRPFACRKKTANKFLHVVAILNVAEDKSAFGQVLSVHHYVDINVRSS